MARSLTVKHEENVGTSPLLTGLLLFAALWLIFGSMVWADAETEAAEVPVETTAP